MPNILSGVGDYAFEEKRSRFIGHCAPVSTEEDARAVIERIRQAHKTATHHVYAYGLLADNILRHSDDGEPQGTAGMPVLHVFQKQNAVDFVCVVTRYFGGILLGAGGLTRAYSKAAKGSLAQAGIQPLIRFTFYRVVCTYARLDQIKYFFDKQGIAIEQIEYGEHCTILAKVPEVEENTFLRCGLYINSQTIQVDK